MELWAELLTTWIGLLSLFVIVFMIGMMAFLITMFIRKSAKKPDQAEGQDKGGIPGSHRHPSH
ncbi:DUF3149 domain-containing protein [Alkalilimnicola ehrlichii MLHE-1]|uniref:DUF3149 domain-containing protein n=1 Tax=Alkalilimnicola ehrlichii (strain ATCC BAA-1101 / DSM 17681 / MLHE-1) TaxID=187272 RepID=Q0A7M6_ALKEH|nr:DUF3149 domain-containing protein [Alkalilimnicola ehrlichii]ABI57161.1 hypothetical protein Mlg_1817 [Alkalilimnicola ehrlichii MLHE-1]